MRSAGVDVHGHRRTAAECKAWVEYALGIEVLGAWPVGGRIHAYVAPVRVSGGYPVILLPPMQEMGDSMDELMSNARRSADARAAAIIMGAEAVGLGEVKHG